MLRLHGLPLSNYYNMVKHSLLEKGLPFEEAFQLPAREPGFLARSPMGKIPVLETEQGWLSESIAIIEYLEEIQCSPRLLPVAPFERARVRQLALMAELYVDAPARRHLEHVLFGRPRSSQAYREVPVELERGIEAIRSQAAGYPWLIGAQFSYADICLFHALRLASLVGERVYGRDPLADSPALCAWRERMMARESSRKVLEEQQQALLQLQGD